MICGADEYAAIGKGWRSITTPSQIILRKYFEIGVRGKYRRYAFGIRSIDFAITCNE